MSIPPAGTAHAPDRRDVNTLARIGMICGIVAGVLTVPGFPIVAVFSAALSSPGLLGVAVLALPTVGLILSVLGLTRSRGRAGSGSGQAVVGIAFSTLSLLAFVPLLVWMAAGRPS